MGKDALIDKINQAIQDRKFDSLEIEGFKKDPYLAFLAGAAIGYQLGLDTWKQFLDKMVK